MQGQLIAALLLGLGGSLHCLGMCGPLVLRLHHGGDSGRPIHTLLYHLSRALAYGLIGAVIGVLGQGLLLIGLQQYLSIVAGVALLILFLQPSFKNIPIPKKIREWNVKNYQKFSSLPSIWKSPALGMLNALLPCGIVYVALGTGLVSSKSPMDGFLFMFIFGLGTLPAMWILSILGLNVSKQRLQSARWVLRSFTLIVAIMLILRGLNLGIPYISPKINSNAQTLGNCCHR